MMSCLGFRSLKAKTFTSAAAVHDCCNRHQSDDASTSLSGHRDAPKTDWLPFYFSCRVLENGF